MVTDNGGVVALRPTLVFVSWRSRWDFYRVGLRGQWRYLLTWLGFLVGIGGLAYTPVELSIGFLLAAVGIVLSIISLYPEWTGMRRGKVHAVKEKKPPNFSRIITFPGLDVVKNPSDLGEIAVVDPAVDEALVTTSAECSWSPRRVPLTTRISKYTYDIMREKWTATTFNDNLVRQDTDLTRDLLVQNGVVHLSPTDYYSLLCTNYMANWRVIERESRQEFPGYTLMVDRQKRLLPLDQNELANVIGVSTLAFTRDGDLALVRQGNQAHSSEGLWAPAGSGSADHQDLKILRRRREPLKEFVARAMRRELMEECRLKETELGETVVLGYFRWINKGGKPEYVGVTRLSVHSHELLERRVRLDEVHYVKHVDTKEIDLARLRSTPDKLLCLPVPVRKEVSTPLYMALRALGHALARGDSRAQQLEQLISP